MRKSRDRSARTFLMLLVLFLSSVMIFCARVQADDCDDAVRIYERVVASPFASEKKINDLRKAANLCPNLVKVRVELANLLLISPAFIKGNQLEKNRCLDESAAHLERALKDDDACVDAHRALAKIYYSQGRFEMARTIYQRLLELQSGMREARIAIKELNQMIPLESSSLKKASEIKKSLEGAPKEKRLNLMGIQAFTVPKHRERFNNITFDEWSYTIRKESESQLQEIGKALIDIQSESVRFAIEGHTDNRGDIDRNQTLSENRAQSVKDYLVFRFGIDPSRITTQGFGLNRPLVSNDTPANMAKNRRVEILFMDSQPINE